MITGGAAFWIFGRMRIGAASISRSEALACSAGASPLSGLLGRPGGAFGRFPPPTASSAVFRRSDWVG